MRHPVPFLIPLLCSFIFCNPVLTAQNIQTVAPGSVSSPRSNSYNSPDSNTVGTSTRRSVVSYVEELAGNTASRLKEIQDENAALELRILDLERRMTALQETNNRLLSELNAIKRQSAADADAREAQTKAILSKIDKLAAMPAQTPVPVPVVPNSAPGNYEIYEVQKGATLSVIAQAYGVTVQEIKKLNNLKSDLLQIGQKLKIPVK